MIELNHKAFGSVGQSSRPASDILSASAKVAPSQQEQEPTKHPELSTSPMRERAIPSVISPVDLRALIELGRVQDSITIGKFKFEMATMDDHMQAEAYELVQQNESGLSGLRRTVVAISLVSVNGQAPEALIEGDTEPLQKRAQLVASLQGSVVEKLYDFYDELLKRSEKDIEPEQAKN